MNKYIKMFMDDHNLKVGEEIRINRGGNNYLPCNYHCDCDGELKNCYDGIYINEIYFLLSGNYTIEKLKKEPWKPKHADEFFVVSVQGAIHCYKYNGLSWQDYLINHHLVFKTEEEAKDYKWFLDKVDEYKKPFEYGEKNYFFYYDYEDDALYTTFNIAEAHQGVIYFDSYDKTQAFIKEVGEDRIKKYMFGIYE